MRISKNIKINNCYAEADFFPEDTKIPGHIIVDLQSEEIFFIRDVQKYEFMYPGHAIKKLIQMAKENDTRTECIVMWY